MSQLLLTGKILGDHWIKLTQLQHPALDVPVLYRLEKFPVKNVQSCPGARGELYFWSCSDLPSLCFTAFTVPGIPALPQIPSWFTQEKWDQDLALWDEMPG